MKSYLNLDGLSHFLNKLLNKFATKEELSAVEDDVLTNSEIDTICETALMPANNLTDIATGIQYTLYVENGKLGMKEV